MRHYKPDDSFSLIFGSRTTGSGCTQCFKYKDFLDGQFLIAIDSDFRYLLQEPDIDMAHYILQTYTYSFENHYCHEENIEKALSISCHDNGISHLFSFTDFLRKYASIVYPLFIHLLYCLRTSNGLYTKDDFFHALNLPPKQQQMVEENGQKVLDILKQQIEKDLDRLKPQLSGFSWRDE